MNRAAEQAQAASTSFHGAPGVAGMSDASISASASLSVSPPQRKRSHPVRLYHKKSRNGCLRCKARRVKCDETKPACGSCTRHKLACTYAPPASPSTKSRGKSRDSITASSIIDRRRSESDATSCHSSRSDHDENEYILIPESRHRRLLELRLSHHFSRVVAEPFQGYEAPLDRLKDVNSSTVWSRLQVPELALDHDNLLNALLALSATSMSLADPENNDLNAAHKIYHGLALHEQRKAVSAMDTSNADAVFFSAMLIFMDSVINMRRRSLEPYTPPLNWLQLGKGVKSVLHLALRLTHDRSKSRLMSIVLPEPTIPVDDENDDWLASIDYTPFSDLLQRIKTRTAPTFDRELEDLETLKTYQRVLGYMATILASVQANASWINISRRVIGFALFVPPRFIDFVAERRPRALCILAHFFALANEVQANWLVRDTPYREIWAISRVLPPEWQPLIGWPKQRVSIVRSRSI